VTGLVPSVCLVILDGWGLAEPGPGNAVELADTPVFDSLWRRYPHGRLIAMGESVGLPPGQMGNSEVGHLNLGAGAIIPQDLALIDKVIEDDALVDNQVLRELVDGATRLHLVGLVSDGRVHSSDRHLHALIDLAARWQVPDVVIHAFTDGRDTHPTDGCACLGSVERWCREAGAGRVGTLIGRYYAMDRDNRWDRTKRAYDLLMHGRAEHTAESAEEALHEAYERDETDEFLGPTVIGDQDSRIRPGDAVLSFNFRPDRMRQLTVALADRRFGEFDRDGAQPVQRFATMTQYEEDWTYPVVFPPHRPEVTLAKLLADGGMRQLHVAETEKYPHVTYFFNGGEEHPYPGETHKMVPSPRDVPTYDFKPEMSAREAAAAFVKHWAIERPTFGIINFANPDMVGHTGVIPAAVKGVETVDECLGRVVEAVSASGGACIVTADHGNADYMLEPDGSPNTAHTLNPVPLIVTVEGVELREEGILADVAPTVLQLLGLEQPPAMTGDSLITRVAGAVSRPHEAMGAAASPRAPRPDAPAQIQPSAQIPPGDPSAA
jgi:2,3-bisphosphoglycerate-independent phosphoglycerate mutase